VVVVDVGNVGVVGKVGKVRKVRKAVEPRCIAALQPINPLSQTFINKHTFYYHSPPYNKYNNYNYSNL